MVYTRVVDQARRFWTTTDQNVRHEIPLHWDLGIALIDRARAEYSPGIPSPWGSL
ncbi:hypothetical protein GALMADRAFT_400260 [Galerina marginata CBS 339.88]|uniref:Uncharacterized protein n=1 Tax=Galerina marginata (strain CBS 339.88) TaxID=685588 RepID=A0A067U1A7_GALM3|nr:hypothetical protein GALMADRAFT_400260 [Galerina marginata CBS 339.88]